LISNIVLQNKIGTVTYVTRFAKTSLPHTSKILRISSTFVYSLLLSSKSEVIKFSDFVNNLSGFTIKVTECKYFIPLLRDGSLLLISDIHL